MDFLCSLWRTHIHTHRSHPIHCTSSPVIGGLRDASGLVVQEVRAAARLAAGVRGAGARRAHEAGAAGGETGRLVGARDVQRQRGEWRRALLTHQVEVLHRLEDTLGVQPGTGEEGGGETRRDIWESNEIASQTASG